jgi:catechol 2,3-dioxygenase-like lactoylglutathione lyase family enzyme
MAKITGVGGVFFRCADPAKTAAWYKQHLGMDVGDYGCNFIAAAGDLTVWAPFKADTDYFGKSGQAFMINLRVDDLHGLLERLEADGIHHVGDVLDESYGRFAWIDDIDGRRVELFQPKG